VSSPTAGLSWTQVTVTGKECTPPDQPDAHAQNEGLACAHCLRPWDQIAWSHAPHALVPQGISRSTRIRACHPGQVIFTVDFGR